MTESVIAKTFNPVTSHQEDSTTGNAVAQKSTGDAGHVNMFSGGHAQSRNRMLLNLTDANQTATWPAGSNIKYLTLIAVRQADTAYTVTLEPYAIVTIDAANETEADANLGTTGAPPAATTTDSQVIVVPLNTPIFVPMTNAITRLDARNVDNVEGIDLWIGAN